jgi:hypothetical protein
VSGPWTIGLWEPLSGVQIVNKGAKGKEAEKGGGLPVVGIFFRVGQADRGSGGGAAVAVSGGHEGGNDVLTVVVVVV